MVRVSAALASLPRPTIEALIDSLIDHLDQIDGDPDIEANGDESEDSEGAFEHRFDDAGRCVGGPHPSSVRVGDSEDDENDDPGLVFAYGLDQRRIPRARWMCQPWNVDRHMPHAVP